jgi:hypothetical protein
MIMNTNDFADEPNKINTGRRDKPKLFYFERTPDGRKLLCISGRRHGKKLVVKLTREQIIKEFDSA